MGLLDSSNLYRKLAQLELDDQSRPAGAIRDDLIRKAVAAEKEARRIGDPALIASSLLRRAEILLTSNQHQQAVPVLAAVREVLHNFPERARKGDWLVRMLEKLARAYAGMEDWHSVSETSQEGIDVTETYRDKVSAPYMRGAYLRFRIGLYSLGARAAFELGDAQLMFERTELSKSHYATIQETQPDPNSLRHEIERVSKDIDAVGSNGDEEKLQRLLQERQNLWIQFSNHQGHGAEIPQFDLDKVKLSLKNDEAVIYYYWLDKQHLLVAFVDRENVSAEICHVSENDRTTIDEMASLAQRVTRSSGYLDEIKTLSDLLLPGNCRKLLSTKERLLLSPHRYLHALPLHALDWKGSYLIERFSVTYVPNLTSLLVTHNGNNEPSFLGVGTCDYYVPGCPLAPLENALREVRDIEKVYVEREIAATILSEHDANEDRLMQMEQSGELSRFTHIHLAVHGANIQSDTPLESHLFLRDSILEALEIANWEIKADLVVLSACCAGQRAIRGRGMDELPGDDLFGVSAAFFSAGARQILSALWPVQDSVARQLMVEFHHNLMSGQTSDRALQSAIKRYLHSVEGEEAMVYYWAPFFLSAIGRPSAEKEFR